jgi:hypothetical protein
MKWIAESNAFTFNSDSADGINPTDMLKMCKCSVCKEFINNNNSNAIA